jgi:hypothetical protein
MLLRRAATLEIKVVWPGSCDGCYKFMVDKNESVANRWRRWRVVTRTTRMLFLVFFLTVLLLVLMLPKRFCGRNWLAGVANSNSRTTWSVDKATNGLYRIHSQIMLFTAAYLLRHDGDSKIDLCDAQGYIKNKVLWRRVDYILVSASMLRSSSKSLLSQSGPNQDENTATFDGSRSKILKSWQHCSHSSFGPPSVASHSPPIV